MVVLEGLRLKNGAPAASALLPGGLWAVVGRAATGKSRMLAAIVRGEPSEGVRERPTPVVEAARTWRTRLATPQSIARATYGARREALAEALATLGLWPVRHEPVSRLTESALAACELLPALDPAARLVVVDGQLDRIDPWVRDAVVDALEASGATTIVSTRDLALADRLGNIVALREGGLGFVGSVSELLDRHGPARIELDAADPGAAAAMADPFSIEARETLDGVLLTAASGQEAAARLLTHGYGSVHAVLVRRPTLLEALRPWT